MKNFLTVLFISVIFFNNTSAQFTRYIVKLKDKNGTPYSLSNPQAYLSQRAIDRRSRYNIAIDSTDLPVTPLYITQIKNVPNVTVLNISKWLNAITIQTSDPNAITTINGFSFVQSSSAIASRIENPARVNQRDSKFESEFVLLNNSSPQIEQLTGDYYNYGANSYNEIHLYNGEFLHNIGLRGQGMQIAMLDNGFNNYISSTLHAFDSANTNKQVLGTWDFVAHEQNVSNDGSHGMACFSTIVANIPGQFVGMAPKANFWLYQTEDNASEYPIEEFNWSCGAETADSVGAEVISTSLGYTTFDNASLNHTYADMNGNITMAAIAADLAAKKGMLVFAAVGNSGTSTWHYLGTPADGDSVIAVGAVNSTGAVGSFSSYGPSSDGQIKPDVASVGMAAVIQSSSGTLAASNGTSFACPKMAGLATCLWQGFPEFNNMKIRSALWQAGSKSNNPDDRVGYGIPDMKKAVMLLLKDFATSNATISNCRTILTWTSKDINTMTYEIERLLPGQSSFTKIGEQFVTGTTFSNHSHLYLDPLDGLPFGMITYRIRQIIDTTGVITADHITTATIFHSEQCTTDLRPVMIIPNPARSQFSLRIATSQAVGNLVIRIFNMQGQLVDEIHQGKSANTITIDVPIAHLARGIYIVRVYQNNLLVKTEKLLKL